MPGAPVAGLGTIPHGGPRLATTAYRTRSRPPAREPATRGDRARRPPLPRERRLSDFRRAARGPWTPALQVAAARHRETEHARGVLVRHPHRVDAAPQGEDLVERDPLAGAVRALEDLGLGRAGCVGLEAGRPLVEHRDRDRPAPHEAAE